jgi:hypothetical protein
MMQVIRIPAMMLGGDALQMLRYSVFVFNRTSHRTDEVMGGS